MDVILVHLGPPVPQYFYTCISQIRKFTQERIIVAATINRNINVPNVEIVPTEQFYNSKINNFLKYQFLDEMKFDGFWKYAALRLYIVESVMEHYKLQHALHIENDNLIYDDPNKTIMESYVGNKIGLTRITESLLSAGIMYVGSLEALSIMTNSLTNIIQRGKENIEHIYGQEMLNEMRLLDIVNIENSNLITLLPMMPSKIEQIDNHLFDCASWGQWVGGTFQNPGEKYAGNHHIIGRELLKGKYDVICENKIPFVICKDTKLKTKLFNLHIHSKDLAKWSFSD
jgi:hypothetical protein